MIMGDTTDPEYFLSSYRRICRAFFMNSQKITREVGLHEAVTIGEYFDHGLAPLRYDWTFDVIYMRLLVEAR